MVDNHIPCERCFAPYSEEQLREREYFSAWGISKNDSLGWEELHEYRCVVILAEGKCGKTHEFRQQHQKLREKNKFSFFISLELLHDCDLLDTLSIEEEPEFERWLIEADKKATFFLDAVDELKLRKGTLRRALRKIQKAIGANCNRASFFVSCRPNDWNEELDLNELARLVPRDEQKTEVEMTLRGEALLSSVLSRSEAHELKSAPKKDYEDQQVKVFALLPLSRNEIVNFAACYAPEKAQVLEKHLNEKELWHLYQLPDDIISALDQLISEGQLGNLEEQLNFSIGNKLREHSDKKRNDLSEERAMEGAERIALALVLMKRRLIYLNTPIGKSEGVNVRDVLMDWSLPNHVELLGKPLFDPVGIGAFRFHHRSTQEFLAAQRLRKLHSYGLADADLFNLLFADVEKERVIIPSMEPIASWLALWNRLILKEVKERNPLLLFRQGIPAMLSVEQKADLIREFVGKFTGSGWRRIGIGNRELKRIATPELTPLVREIWEQAYKGHDTRELLLELIYFSPMPDCVDLSFHATYDEEIPHQHRLYAAWAVLSFGDTEQKRTIGESVLRRELPELLIRNVLPELLPETVSLEEFLGLASSLTEVPNSVHGLGYSLLQTINSESLPKAQKIIVRDSFAQTIWKNRTDKSRIYQAQSSYDHFVDPLIVACSLTLPSCEEDNSKWAWCLAVAFHFGEKRTSIIARKETEQLLELLSTNVSLREAYFWACFDLSEGLEKPKNDWQRFIQSDYDGVLRPLTHEDYPWLFKALSTNEVDEKRGVAFYALASLVEEENSSEFNDKIRRLVLDRVDLSEELERIINPPPRKLSKHEIQHKQWEKKAKAKEAARIEGWALWRQKVLGAEDFLLGEADRDTTLYNLYKYIQQTHVESSNWGHWSSSFVRDTFSEEFLNKVREELYRYWRETDVQIYSERSEEMRNRHPHSSLVALSAIKCNAEEPNWVESLSKDEAIKATRISTIELNGFASFLFEIEEEHPQAVEQVIGKEIKEQVEGFDNQGSAPILHDIRYHASDFIQRIASHFIIEGLEAIEVKAKKNTRDSLGYAFDIIALKGSDSVIRKAVNIVQNQFEDSSQLTVEDLSFWVKLLAKLDVESACEKILSITKTNPLKDDRNKAEALFAEVFGGRNMGGQPSFERIEPRRRLNLLKDLVIRVYQTVRPENDLHHEGSYSPSTRDYAEQARSYLLQELATTHSPRTLSVLHGLSSRSEFAHISDRLKQMATELAANISEPETMSAAAFQSFDQKLNYKPYDNHSLFSVMSNRLLDFEHHLINDEHSVIDTFRKAESESEIRNFISYWLNQNSRGAYTITQEAVVVTEKRTDIRLHVNGLDKYAAIELKVDDRKNKWSGAALKQALVDQLVGRYLNHKRCQVGCLLICMREPRRWKNPETGKHMSLGETVTWLQRLANEIVEERSELHLLVKGIDYSKSANE